MPLPCPWADPVGSALAPEECGQQSHLGNCAVVQFQAALFHFPGLRFKLPGGVSSRNVGRTTGTTLVSRQLEAYWTKNGKAENSLDEVPASRVTEFDKAAELERRLLSSCSRPSWTHTVGPSLHAESHQTSSLWGHTRGDGTPSPRTGDPVQQFNRQGAGSPSVGGCSICAFNVTSFRGHAWCAFKR